MNLRTCIAILALSGIVIPASSAFAATADMRFQSSKADVRAGCNQGGGTLLGVSDLGSYGCEFDDGNMVLCNKKDVCTHYSPRTVPTRLRRLFHGRIVR